MDGASSLTIASLSSYTSSSVIGRMVSIVCSAFHGHFSRSASIVSRRRENAASFSSFVCIDYFAIFVGTNLIIIIVI